MRTTKELDATTRLAATVLLACLCVTITLIGSCVTAKKYPLDTPSIVFESNDFDWEDYEKQIYMLIWRRWHRELLDAASRKLFSQELGGDSVWFTIDVTIRVTIQRDGVVTDVVFVEPSTTETVNRVTKATLVETPLLPLPEECPREQEIVIMRFGPVDGTELSIYETVSVLKRTGFLAE